MSLPIDLKSIPANIAVGVGAIALLIDLAILMPLSKLYTGSTNVIGKATAVSFTFLHSFVYSIFMFGTVWVYLSEIFPTKYRAQGTAICTFWGQVMGTILQQFGLQIYDDIGYLFYIDFIVCTAIAGLVYFFLLPETKGRTLEDISAFFGDEVVATLHEPKTRIEHVLNEVAGYTEGSFDVQHQNIPGVRKPRAEEVEEVPGV